MIISSLINPRRACAARVTVVGSVCVSVKSHLTSEASVRPENAVTFSAGNEGQKICGVFSETAPLQRSSTPSVDGHTYSRPFFLRKAARMRIIVFTTCGGGPKRPFLPSSCAELKVVVSFVSCHWSCLQARSVHNVMLFCTFGRAYIQSAIFPAEITHAHSRPALCFSRPALPLAAQRNGGRPMCQSGLPADAASLRETSIVDRYTPPVGPCPIE